jgi:hypothetical protein
MRLSWNEIRARAAAFADEWRDARYERGETQSFYNDFFQFIGVKRRAVARYEEPVKKLGDKRGFMPPVVRKAHHDLDKAVDKLYRVAPFHDDRERVEYLFTLYEKLVTPLTAAPKTKRKNRVSAAA